MEAGTMAPSADQPSAEQIIAQLKAEQNFLLAIPAGIAAAIVGAILWAAAVYVTDMEIGLIAVAVGALVGYAIKLTGKGVEAKFGLLGAVCAALGWGLGTVLSDIATLSHIRKIPVLDAVQLLDLPRLMALVTAVFQPMDVLFLAIAVYEGYKFSFRYRLKTQPIAAGPLRPRPAPGSTPG